jgi:hypothetical protein
MKSQPKAANQEVLAGLIERVTYHNAENGFCVLRAKVRGHCDVVTVVGHAAPIAADECGRLSSQVVLARPGLAATRHNSCFPYASHNRNGKQLPG